MAFRLGPLEIGIILVIIIMIFGVGKLPQVSEAIGRGLRSLRKGESGEEEETPKTKTKVIRQIEDIETPGKVTGEVAEDKTEPKAS